MSDRVIVIDENNVTVDGIAYKTQVATSTDCDNCAFCTDEACGEVPYCSAENRREGDDVIWVTAV